MTEINWYFCDFKTSALQTVAVSFCVQTVADQYVTLQQFVPIGSQLCVTIQHYHSENFFLI